MSKKKILVMIDWFYPGYRAGGPVRSCFNVIERLGHEFEFKVITRDTDYCESVPYKGIIPNTWTTHPNGLIVHYLTESKLNSSGIESLIRNEDPDLLWINGIYSKWFSIMPLRKWKGKTIISARGMLNPEALKIKALKKRIFLTVARLTGMFDHVIFHATNNDEKNNIIKHFPNARIIIAPNFPVMESPFPKKKEKNVNMLRLVNIARIAPEKNILYGLELLKEFGNEIGADQKIILDIFGTVYDPDYFEKCKEASDSLPACISVNFKGGIDPKAVSEALSNYDMLFFPSRSENYGHTVVQAMSCGLPVIISDATPWRGLELRRCGWDINLPDKSKFIQVLKKSLLMDVTVYHELSIGAKAFAQQILNDPQTLVLNQNLFRS